MGLGIFTKEVNDESNDRLNHFFTFLLLLCCVVVTCKRQYLGSPISCWVPKEFTKAHVEYTEGACWALNTYHLPHDRPIPQGLPERKAEELPYYQWVAFLLLGQALMFQLPSLFWSSCLDRRGLRLQRALQLAADSQDLRSRRARHQTVASVAGHLGEALDTEASKAASESPCWTRLNPPDSRLCRAYLATKLLYIGTTAAQFFIINSYLTAGTRTVAYGFSLAVNLTLGRNWEESGYFPRVTYCDLLIRVLGNEQRHTVQCVLQINRLNEKVYALLWFWLLGLGCLTGRSIIIWCWRLLRKTSRHRYVAQLLRTRNCTGVGIGRFVKSLGQDGVLLLALVDSNAGPSAAAEICEELWRRSRCPMPESGSVFASASSDPASSSPSPTAAANAVVRWETDDQV